MKPDGDRNREAGKLERSVGSREAADFLGIHYKSVERMARMGDVPAAKSGKAWQFLLSLLDEWRREQMRSNLTKTSQIPQTEKENNIIERDDSNRTER
jgi:excisionase family DNA binding protein